MTNRWGIGVRWPVAVTAVGIAVAAGGGAAVASSRSEPAPSGPAPHVVRVPEGLDADKAAAAAAEVSVGDHSHCAVPAKDRVPDGMPIVVSLPPAPPFTVGRITPSWWRNPPVSSPSWQLSFLGLTWLPPLAQRAADDGQLKSLAALVDQAVAFHRRNPDPGNNRYGWDEGTAMRRLQSLNCLYGLSRSPRLVSPMTADVAVQLGSRYYGPPLHGVHNHGVMANLAVLAAAQLLGRTAWRDRAIGRLRSEAPQAWTRAGTTWEQSTGYHRVNINLWNSAADAIARLYPKDRTIALIRALTARASRVYAWLTEPDGKVVLIGDADEVKGETRSTWTARVFRDDQAGLVVGRWSWRDPGTTYYTLRYGPPRSAHGQQDRVGVTWTTRNRRVLVDPGRATDTSGYQAYVLAPVSHNVAYPAGNLDTRASASVAAETVRSPAHSWTLVDRLFGTLHVRGVAVDDRNARLTVSDGFGGRGSFRQTWHLDPTWSLGSRSRDGKRLTFGAGRRGLVVTTTGVFSEVVRGRTRPQAGWHFPRRGRRVPAYEITVNWSAGRVTTSFTVR